MADDVRQRILEATLSCIARYGLAKTTVEDAARAAGLSRATIYRHFPGGREELVREVVAGETRRFVEELAAAVEETEGLAELVSSTIMVARRGLLEHAVLQKVLQTEPERILPQLNRQSPRVVGLLADFLLPHLNDRALREGLDPGRAAEYLARMILSVTLSPGRWDLRDREAVGELVRVEMLGAVMA